MMKYSLTAVAREHLETAQTVSSGRSSGTVVGGHERVLRQTVITLLAGRSLGEHLSPGEATLLVLSGRVRMISGLREWVAREGDLLVVPEGSSEVHAIADSAMLLTVAKVDRVARG